MINRAAFFTIMRRKLGALTQGRVDGTNAILDAWEKTYCARTSVPQLAVCLATSYHETGFTMKPISEHGNGAYFTRLYGIEGGNPTRARKMGNVHPGDGIKYNGKGLVQLTWFVNYEKATKRLRELKLIDPGIDFTAHPELVMEERFAIPIMFIGMEEGWFTGRSLDDIVDDNIDGDEYADFVKSRAIINGKDAAEKIAGYAMAFLEALQASVDMKAAIRVNPPDAKKSVQSIAPAAPAPQEGHPAAGAWNKFWMAVADLYGAKRG